MKRKIAIQTHPLKTNYGGILQAFALQHWLGRQGYDAIHLNRNFKTTDWLLRLKQILYRIVYFREITVKRNVEAVYNSFINRYIQLSPPLNSNKEWIQFIQNNNFTAVITGSDQVWRKEYTGAWINEYFLNFIKGDIKKIAYAASFGVDSIDADYAAKIGAFLKDFDAISVREDSGVKILKDNFNLDAAHLPDPTMLLKAEDYVSIFDLQKENENPFVFAYVLDKNKDKQNIINDVGSALGLKSKFVYGAEVTKETWRDKDIANKVSIEQWLQNYYNADFVVTDSFHGTVFSIVFNKPFLVIGNERRGMSRFHSLLTMFGLQDRLITDFASFDANKLIAKEIDWESVNDKLEMEREKAVKFLKENLK